MRLAVVAQRKRAATGVESVMEVLQFASHLHRLPQPTRLRSCVTGRSVRAAQSPKAVAGQFGGRAAMHVASIAFPTGF